MPSFKRAPKYRRDAAAKARAQRYAQAPAGTQAAALKDLHLHLPSDSELGECNYVGGVSACLQTDSESEPEILCLDSNSSESDCFSEMDDGDYGIISHSIPKPPSSVLPPKKVSLYELIAGNKSVTAWKDAEQNRALDYSGNSKWMRQRREQQTRTNIKQKEEARTL